jgi:hypothetical protein
MHASAKESTIFSADIFFHRFVCFCHRFPNFGLCSVSVVKSAWLQNQIEGKASNKALSF